MNWNFDRFLLLEENPDAVIATSEDGEILFWSKGAEAIFGYLSSEIIGRSLIETIIPADKIEEESTVFRKAVESGFAN